MLAKDINRAEKELKVLANVISRAEKELKCLQVVESL